MKKKKGQCAIDVDLQFFIDIFHSIRSAQKGSTGITRIDISTEDRYIQQNTTKKLYHLRPSKTHYISFLSASFDFPFHTVVIIVVIRDTTATITNAIILIMRILQRRKMTRGRS